MKKKSIIILIAVLIVLGAKAGIYRHDRKEKEYTKLAAQPQFKCVGQLWKENEFAGSCVLVGNKYVLTAAHSVVDVLTKPETIKNGNQVITVNKIYDRHLAIAAAYSVKFNGFKYRCKAFKIYPGYMDTATHEGLDNALIELEEEIKDARPAVMSATFDELNADVTGVGYGAYGPADKPQQISKGPMKLAGENVIDSIGGYELDHKPTTMYCDFDHPGNPACNRMGSPAPCNLEYICSGGDSGGGLFRQTTTGWELIGTCQGSAIEIGRMMKTGYYGQIMTWMRVSVFKAWIEENMN